MPQLHETRMGKKFFEADIPNLIQALERIADNLGNRALLHTIAKEEQHMTESEVEETVAELVKYNEQAPKKCIWILPNPEAGEYHDSTCGRIIMHSKHDIIHFKYCPYCSRKIEVIDETQNKGKRCP